MKKKFSDTDVSWTYIWGQYMRQYWPVILMFAVFAGVFAVIFGLYQLEMEAIYYAAGLCLLVMAAVMPFHFVKFAARHRERVRILKHICLLAGELPAPKTLAEKDMLAMIMALKGQLAETENSWENERQESLDYYTTWVHQIKTPIAVMSMSLQAEDTPEHRELSEELFRIEQYVDMVLSYLRLGSRTSDFVFKSYDLDKIIRQAVRKFAPSFIKKHLRFVYEPVTMTVLTDEKWLLFMIEQILSNAIKYTREGSVSIRLNGEVLEIADTGIGIAPEDVPRIFEKGFTGYNGRADKKATGLGLYLCRQAADRLSHKVTVRSKVGEGTVFCIDLHTDRLEVE